VSAEAQVRQVVDGVREVLGAELVGMYLFGSAVLGGLRPRSDVDVLALIRRSTTSEEKRALIEHLLAVSRRPRHVELTIVTQPAIHPWRYPPERDFQYGDWWRDRFEAGELEPWPAPTDPDVASLVTLVRHADHPLLGPPPAHVFDPVPRDDYVAALRTCVRDVVADLRAGSDDTRNYVLTLARVWHSLATGDLAPKDRAAAWALGRLPPVHRPVLARARAIYLGEEDERWDDLRPDVLAWADHVAGEIGRVEP
jgi:predicted nucleotidyltransferase